MRITNMKKMQEESERLNELREQIVAMAFDECKESVEEMLDEINELYFQWIERIIDESQEQFEVVASQPPNGNIIQIDFGKKK